jgi:transposase
MVRLLHVGRGLEVEIDIRPRKGVRARCGKCRQPGPGYDRQRVRRYQYVPLWNIPVFFCYAKRRVDCPRCGPRAEWVPWGKGKQQLTTTYMWFLAGWAKRLSWTATAEAFHTSWTHVYRSVAMAVAWGKAHRELRGIRAIGIDEIQWRAGNRYLTLVYQIDAGCHRLLWIGQDRTKRTLENFFRWMTRPRRAELRFVCSDMWKAYITVVAKWAPQAKHVLDRFHVMLNMNKAMDKVRAEEARELRARVTNRCWPRPAGCYCRGRRT